MKWKCVCLVALMAYIFFAFYLAVISRDIIKYDDPVKLDLFRCYYQPSGDSYRDVYVNIFGFIPVGALVALLSRRHRVVKALLAGLLISLAIEVSQLIWKKGVFDVDDLMNNAIGALIGGVIAVVVMRMLARKMTLTAPKVVL